MSTSIFASTSAFTLLSAAAFGSAAAPATESACDCAAPGSTGARAAASASAALDAFDRAAPAGSPATFSASSARGVGRLRARLDAIVDLDLTAHLALNVGVTRAIARGLGFADLGLGVARLLRLHRRGLRGDLALDGALRVTRDAADLALDRARCCSRGRPDPGRHRPPHPARPAPRSRPTTDPCRRRHRGHRSRHPTRVPSSRHPSLREHHPHPRCS